MAGRRIKYQGGGVGKPKKLGIFLIDKIQPETCNNKYDNPHNTWIFGITVEW